MSNEENATATFELFDSTLAEITPELLGLWIAQPLTADVSFGIDAPAIADIPLWRSNFPANLAESHQILAASETNLKATQQTLDTVPDRLDRLLKLADFTGNDALSFDLSAKEQSLSQSEQELLTALQNLRDSGQPQSFDVDFSIGKASTTIWTQAAKQFQVVAQRAIAIVANYAAIETQIQGNTFARTTVSWTGDFNTLWINGVNAEQQKLHQRSLTLALASRSILLQNLTMTVQLALTVSVALSLPGGAILALPTVWRFIHQVTNQVIRNKDGRELMNSNINGNEVSFHPTPDAPLDSTTTRNNKEKEDNSKSHDHKTDSYEDTDDSTSDSSSESSPSKPFGTFEITIQRKVGDYYPVVAEHSPPEQLSVLSTRAEDKLQLTPQDIDTLTSLLLQPKAYGTYLGQLLFQRDLRDAFASALGKSEGLRVLLFIEAEDTELKRLRWERLCAPIDRGDKGWNFLRRDQRTPFSLYIPSITDRLFPPIGRNDLRVLVLVASPENSERYGLNSFDVRATIASIRSALKNFDLEKKVDVLAYKEDVTDAIGPPNLSALCYYLTRQPYTLLHIVSHGALMQNKEDTVLYWADENNQTDPVTGKELMEQLRNIGGAKGLPRFTFLCTCESASQSTEGALGGLAEQLVRNLGMPAVVAMTDKITIKTAEKLIEPFYRQLQAHGHVDQALDEATAHLGDRDDVLVPALYSRLGGRPLFSDNFNRLLTPEESKHGLDLFELLIKQRAPILKEKFEEQKKIILENFTAKMSELDSETRQKCQSALEALNKLSTEVLDRSFNALAFDKPVPKYDDRCPFPGFCPFRLEEQEFFFGREELIKTLQDKLKENPFLAISGASGSGKSSLVLAGLIPALRKEEPTLQLADMTLTDKPLEQLQESLAKAKGQPFILVVDQFEKLFTHCDDENQKAFIQELVKLQNPQQKIILIMRDSFWEECAAYPELNSLMQNQTETIAPLNAMELRSVMEQQASVVGLRFEIGLQNVILDDVENEPGAMPLLQHVLRELWQRRHGRWLCHAEYENLGGVQGIIDATADTFYKTSFKDIEQKLVKNIFLRLIRLDKESVQSIQKRVQVLDDLVPWTGNPAQAKTQIKKLVHRLASKDAHLVVISASSNNHPPKVVAYEALIRGWKELQKWLNNNERNNLLLRDRIREAAKDWETNKGSQKQQKEEELRRLGGQLGVAEELLKQSDFLNNSEAAYVNACIDLRDRQKREQKRRVQVLSGLVILTSVALVSTLYQLQRNQRQQVEQFATTAEALLAVHPIDAEVNAIAAIGVSQSWFVQFPDYPRFVSAEGSLLNAIQENRERYRLEHQGAVRAIALSPDGQQIASSGDDYQIYLWDARTGKPIGKPLRGHQGTVRAIAFSPDGKRIVSGSRDKTIRLWDAQTGEPIGNFLQGNDGWVMSVAFSPDGKQIVSGSGDYREPEKIPSGKQDNSIRLRDVKTGQFFWQVTLENGAAVNSVEYSPDGKQIVSGSADKTIRLWDAQTGKQLGEPLKGHTDGVNSVDYSLDGKQIVSGSADHTLRLWNVKARQQIGESWRGHTESVYSVAFSRNGTQVVSGSWDKTVRVWKWNDQTGEPIGKPLQGHTASVYSVAFNPQNKEEIISGGEDGSVRLWERTSSKIMHTLPSAEGEVMSVAFSRDGKRMVSGGKDKSVQLWDVETGQPIGKPWQGHTAWVTSVGFSPDGKRIVSGSYDNTVRLWDITGQPLWQAFVGYGKAISSVAFSPDGKQIVSGSADKTVRLWDAEMGQPFGQPFQGHEKLVKSVAFSPDGKRIVSGSDDRTVRLWDAKTGKQLGAPLKGHGNVVNSVVFSPNGKQIVSGSADQTVRLWNAQTGKSLKELKVQEYLNYRLNHPLYTTAGKLSKELKGHRDRVFSVAFSPDGKRIVSGSKQEIRLWDAQTGKQIGNPLAVPWSGKGPSDNDLGLVYSIVFSPDGKQIVSGSWDYTVRLWDIAPERWLQLACQQLQNYSILTNPTTPAARKAQKTCQPLWSKQ